MSSQTTPTIPPVIVTASPLPGAQSAFDGRLIEVSIALPDKTYTFDQNYMITAFGSKFANGNFNSCECRIYNLTKQMRQTIISQSSPLLIAGFLPKNTTLSEANAPDNFKPAILTLRVGRVSTGMFTLFSGNIITGEITQPPDIGLTFRALTNNIANNEIMGYGFPASTQLSNIASQIATFCGLVLNFQATDRIINNFVMNPVIGKNIDELNKIPGVFAHADNFTLNVQDVGKPLKNTNFIISDATGLVGIPQVTDIGTTVTVMLNSSIQIGGEVTINSLVNPQANGTYTVLKMDYELASREQPFWYTLLCTASPLFYQGNVS